MALFLATRLVGISVCVVLLAIPALTTGEGLDDLVSIDNSLRGVSDAERLAYNDYNGGNLAIGCRLQPRCTGLIPKSFVRFWTDMLVQCGRVCPSVPQKQIADLLISFPYFVASEGLGPVTMREAAGALTAAVPSAIAVKTCDEILGMMVMGMKQGASLDQAAAGIRELLSLVSPDAGVPVPTPIRKMRRKK